MMQAPFFMCGTAALAIPGAEGHAQLAHTALNHSKKPRREHQGRRIAEAHRVIDELERLANEFAEAARR
jgi:hypothetical protein